MDTSVSIKPSVVLLCASERVNYSDWWEPFPPKMLISPQNVVE